MSRETIPENTALWHFFRSYVAAALWSTNDNADPETGGEPLDANYDLDDIADETFKRMEEDCIAFYRTHEATIHCEGAPLSNEDGPLRHREASMAGHDFWLTRCRHGVGFWDGDWPEPSATILDNACKEAGEVELTQATPAERVVRLRGKD